MTCQSIFCWSDNNWYLWERRLIDVFDMKLQYQMSHAMRNRASGHMQTANAQISLHIRSVWSGPLPVNRIIGYRIMYQWRINAWMRLYECTRWIWICVFAHIFACRGRDSFITWQRILFTPGEGASGSLTLIYWDWAVSRYQHLFVCLQMGFVQNLNNIICHLFQTVQNNAEYRARALPWNSYVLKETIF